MSNMSPYRLGIIALAGVALLASLGLWFFGGSFPRVLEILFARPGGPLPTTLSHPLYAAVFAILYSASLALAGGAVLAAGRQQTLDLRGRLALVLAGVVMAVGGVGIAWAMQNAISVISIVAMSETQVKASEIQGAVSEIAPRMQFGLTALCLPPIGLLLCGLIGFGPPAGGPGRPPLPWLHPLSVAVAGLLLVVVFVAAIPAAIRLPELLFSTQAIKASEVVAVIERLLSIGRVSGVLFVIFGLVIANLATITTGPNASAAVKN
jgi:hypothetical protein